MTARFSCVVDDDPRFARQALLWAASLMIYGLQSAESLVVHTIGDGDPRLRELLGSWGVQVVPVEAFDERHPYSNKLAQFGSGALGGAGHVVLCDCDLAFAAPITPWLRGDRIRARIAQRPQLREEQWAALFAEAGLRLPGRRVLAGNGEPTPAAFCNGGLYVLPGRLFAEFGDAWSTWNRWLLDRIELLGPAHMFADQVSFAIACEHLGHTVDYLPIDLNYHTRGSSAALRGSGRRYAEPRVLHYHRMVGPRGLLRMERISSRNAATERINDVIRNLKELYPFDEPADG
ncbi:hypothetical protein [Actinoplanes sp. L3-i22]|uniref:hypothetical protein n=1 Tax=Actinoplanes sp. L3-i22 TaxID=2836373 RepID=UPI001C790BB2|nr:hypothetical protein [Actinoplanes sp. L3-i22]BCY09658.1 hypothetical protein L3i22_047460 [Actinoplanes sp. L3-i22]